MTAILAPLTLLALTAPPVESKFEQVLPNPPDGKLMARSEGQGRAVILIHGLYLHPFSRENVARPLLRDWQEPSSLLARELVKHGDVYAFAYAQDVPVEDVAAGSRLPEHMAWLKKAGYREIVLVGHSAGGVVARQFVEDFPDAGVTKVIQVCSPNGGSSWANLKAARRNQHVFLRSLTKEERKRVLDLREEKRIPTAVEFVCVVGTGAGSGDGIVARSCQWTEDLRDQGVPALPLSVLHPGAMRSARTVEVLADLVRKETPRWTKERVTSSMKQILDD